MIHFNWTFVVLVILLPLYSKWILASAFHVTVSSLQIHTFPLASSVSRNNNNLVCLRSTIDDDSEDHATKQKQTASMSGYSILLADSRERVLDIKLYRFGGSTVEEHMKAKPDLASYKNALRSLTPTFDDQGKQKVYYGNGDTGESVQFFALADDISSFVAKEEHDEDEKVQVSLLRTHGVIGSVEAVKEPIKDGEHGEQVSIELKNLSVHENARRRGIGKALTEAVQQYARDQVSLLEQQQNQENKGNVHLIVESENKGAMRLYHETSFVPETDVNDQLCKLKWSTR